MRMLRALIVLGGAGALVALPPEDYARFLAGAGEASSRALSLIDQHIVKHVQSHFAEGRRVEIVRAPAPRPVERPALVSEVARQHLVNLRGTDAEVPLASRDTAVGGVATPTSAPEVRPVSHVVSDARPADLDARPDSGRVIEASEPPVVVATNTSEASAKIMAPVPAPVPAVRASSGSDAAVSARQEADGAQAAGNDRADDDGKGDAASGDAAEGVAAPDVAAAGVPPIPGQKPNDVPEKEPPVAAKLLFGAVKTPAALASRAVGYYSRGCLSGGKALPIDGAAWQAMRLSRNRNWGHPKLVAMIERLATEAQKEDGWPGLLVGDMSQPRGGPMLTGHASHQIGLDADIWFTPMPSRRLSRRERENLSATSMIDGPLRVDPTAFTPSHVKVVKRAASYPEVERILVHPAIKKALCEAAGQDRSWLGKVRPYFGHYYHFHVRIGCPAGSDNCRKQTAPSGEDGCGKELDQWFVRLTRPPSKPKPKPPGYKPPPPKPPISLADLPTECKVVLGAGDSDVVENQAELVKSSIERSKHIIDISGKLRSRALAR